MTQPSHDTREAHGILTCEMAERSRRALLAELDTLREALREARELAVAVMDKDIGEVSDEARTLLGRVNAVLQDLPSADDVLGILADDARVAQLAEAADSRVKGDKKGDRDGKSPSADTAQEGG